MTVARPGGLWRASLTLLMGGAAAQLVPLLLGPLITRLYSPQAMGVFTSFTAWSATLAVLACLRYDFALPMVRRDGHAADLFALCLRLLAVSSLLTGGLAIALSRHGDWPLAAWLPLAVLAAAAVQLLVMWATRAQRYRAMAWSRLVQYGGAAVLQVLLGAWLWQRAERGEAVPVSEAALALVVAVIVACGLASLPLLGARPAGGWLGGQWPGAVRRGRLKALAVAYKDFPLYNTPNAFAGALQDALAVALILACTGEAAAGFWGLALRYLKAPAGLVGQAVSQAVYPQLVRAEAVQGQRLVRQLMAVLGGLALVLMAVLLLLGPWLFETVFGARWREAGELARALAPYIAAHFVAAPLAVVTMAWQAQAWALRYALWGQLAFVLALWAGLSWHGLLGGAWAVSAAMSVYFGFYFYRLATWRRVPDPKSASASP